MFYKLYHLTLTLMPYSSSFILNQKGKCALDLLSNWEFEQLNSDHLSPFTSCFLCKMCHKNQSPAQTTIEWSCQFEWWTERRACPCLIWGAEVGPWCVWGVCVCVCVCVCLCVFVCVCVLSHVWLFVTSWNVACQAPLSMGFSRQECWSALPFPSPGDRPNPRIEPASLASPAWILYQYTTWEAQGHGYVTKRKTSG